MNVVAKKQLKRLLVTCLRPLPVPGHASDASPALHLRWRLGWLKGLAYRLSFVLRRSLGGPTVQIGRRFAVQGKLRIKGPGTVIFGDDVIVDSKTDLYTHSPAAVLSIGSRSFLNGTRFGCQESIEIGEEAILADARIMDTDFHAVSKRRHQKDTPVETLPIRIGRNVWVSAGSAVLKGVTIGDNSVVAFGSVVTKAVPSDTIAGGNPAKVICPVPD